MDFLSIFYPSSPSPSSLPFEIRAPSEWFDQDGFVIDGDSLLLFILKQKRLVSKHAALYGDIYTSKTNKEKVETMKSQPETKSSASEIDDINQAIGIFEEEQEEYDEEEEDDDDEAGYDFEDDRIEGRNYFQIYREIYASKFTLNTTKEKVGTKKFQTETKSTSEINGIDQAIRIYEEQEQEKEKEQGNEIEVNGIEGSEFQIDNNFGRPTVHILFAVRRFLKRIIDLVIVVK